MRRRPSGSGRGRPDCDGSQGHGTGGLGQAEEPREGHEAPLGSPRHPAATYPFRRVGAGPQGAVNTRPASRSAASLRLAAAGSLSVFDQSQPRVR